MLFFSFIILFFLVLHLKATANLATPSSPCPDYEHVQSTPLLDLLSVSIHTTHNTTSDVVDGSEKDQKLFEVYGSIQLIDVENNCASYVYRHPRNKPETLLPGYNLTLINSKGSYCSLLIPRAAAYKMLFNLKDAKFDDEVIAKGDFDLQLLNGKDGYRDKIMTQVVPGRNGFYASVKYATLPYAVVATVKLTLTKIGETGSYQSESSLARIYGCISASSKLQQGNVISSVLLDKPPSDPLMVNFGKPIQLSRHVLAVPAYSSLEIKADLWDHLTNQQIATDFTLANFEAQDKDVKVEECILGQSYHVQVQICWNNVYGLLDNGRKPFVKLQILHSERSYSTLSTRWSEESMKSSPIPYFSGSPLAEVFSITVFPDDANSSLYGTIGVYGDESFGGRKDPYYLFNRDASNPVSLSRDMKINSLVWPESPFLGECFGMRLHLSDDKGFDVCRGYLYWDKLSTTFPDGKLISSVIRGDHGYALVHYAIIPNAVQAKVRVQVLHYERGFRCMVVGNVSAWYSSVTYSNKFFRSTLLGDDVHSMTLHSILDLQKTVVVVPLNSTLVLGLKFKVGEIGKSSENHWISNYIDSFDEVMDFKVNVGKTCFKSIAGKGCKVEVLVRWTKLTD